MAFFRDLSQAMKEDRVNLLKYVLAGAVGFGIGFLFMYVWVSYTDMFPGAPKNVGFGLFYSYRAVGYAMAGIIGGIFLQYVSKITMNKILFGLFSAIGFAVGGVISEILLIMSSIPALILGWILGDIGLMSEILFIIILICFMIMGVMIGGAVVGAFYGFAVKKIQQLTINGAICFAVGGMVSGIFIKPTDLMSYIIFGTIVGASLGIGMYIAEKR
ncbi:MAG: hypothetical protein QMC78_04230 [Methanocellales archaeon]|nr:hypothetical protein [Methanocellales archaeon]